MKSYSRQRDSNAWIFQTWAAFGLSIGSTTIGIVNLPVGNWIKGFMGMGLAFSVGSTFTLQKLLETCTKLQKLSLELMKPM